MVEKLGDLGGPVAAGVYNVYTGELVGTPMPAAAQLGLEPPRFCAECGRRMVVQVRPDGWWARCSRHGQVDSADLETAAVTEPSGPQLLPRVSRTCAIVAMALGLLITGVLVGGLWSWIAPSIHAVVAIAGSGKRVHDYLGTESGNFFVAPFLMMGLMTVLAVVAPVLAWQWREHRGPGMAVGLSIGLMAAAGVATAAGALLVRLRCGALDFETVPLSGASHRLTYVTQAPPVFFGRLPLQMAISLLAPAGIAALVYALLAAGNPRDDLGGCPLADQPQVAPVEPQNPEKRCQAATGDGDGSSDR